MKTKLEKSSSKSETTNKPAVREPADEAPAATHADDLKALAEAAGVRADVVPA